MSPVLGVHEHAIDDWIMLYLCIANRESRFPLVGFRISPIQSNYSYIQDFFFINYKLVIIFPAYIIIRAQYGRIMNYIIMSIPWGIGRKEWLRFHITKPCQTNSLYFYLNFSNEQWYFHNHANLQNYWLRSFADGFA